MRRFAIQRFVVALMVTMATCFLLTGCGTYGETVGTPIATAIPTATKPATPTVITDFEAFTSAEIQALTASEMSDAKKLAINKLQTVMAGTVNSRAEFDERQDTHGRTLKFGLNMNINVYDAVTKEGLRGIVDPLPGFAVIGINVQETAADGTTQQLLLTTNDPTLKSNWIEVHLVRINKDAFGVEWGRGKGGQSGWANIVWNDTVGEIIEIRFPAGINNQTALTPEELSEYLKLEGYLANENSPRPPCVVIDLATHTPNTTPLPYWYVSSFDG